MIDEYLLLSEVDSFEAFLLRSDVTVPSGSLRTSDYLELIGVPERRRATSPFDPGYDPFTFEGHLEQSAHLMEMMKISMAGWIIASEEVTRRKVALCRQHGVPTVTGGGPFEIAVAQGHLNEYLDLVADLGFTRIEAGMGFTDMPLRPEQVMLAATARGLEVQFELGKKHEGAFTGDVVSDLIDMGRRWLGAGAAQLVIEARESARGVGLFDDDGKLQADAADRFANAFGLELSIFEAPDKRSQFALLNHFGPDVHLCNVRLEEILRVEIYRRGLHSDAFGHDNLRPARPADQEAN
jgi:phosphosulfolactate synthase